MQPTYALVTGASSGIGKAIATQLASRGINVLLIALPGSGLAEVAAELRAKYRVLVRYFESDLGAGDSIENVASWIEQNRFSLRILVNNAGFGNLESFERSDLSFLVNMLMVNNVAMVRLTKACIPYLKMHRRSHIMNVGSLASFLPIPNKVVYSASKSFVYAFSTALRVELGRTNIAVTCLCPGGTRTSAGNVARIAKVKAPKGIFIQEPEEVAFEAVEGMLRSKKRIIPGTTNKIMFLLYRSLPQFLVEWILLKLFASTGKSLPRMAPRSIALAVVQR